VPPREWRLRVEDILDAAGRIARYVEGKDLAAFVSDDLVLDAVSRCFGIIGEAATRVPEDIVAVHPPESDCWSFRAAAAVPIQSPLARALHAGVPDREK